MGRPAVYVADLTHTAQGIAALSFPLGAGYVTASAAAACPELSFRLFKFPEDLTTAIVEEPPAVLAFSNYAWNLRLSLTVAAWAKSRVPGLIVVMGGPNYPSDPGERRDWLVEHGDVDVYIRNEGDIAFAALLTRLLTDGLSMEGLCREKTALDNCDYLADGRLVSGALVRVLDVGALASPYLSGTLDQFFFHPLVPMIETTRGCPFRCTYCSDGQEAKNKVVRFTPERVRAELLYMAERVRNVAELTVTDLNFGMYKDDIATARAIADIRRDFGWPIVIKGSAGKNQTERIIKVASILNGTWVIGSSIQSSDPEVLTNIKRDNISLDAYRHFIAFVNEGDPDAQSYTEVILGLPGDTLDKHFASLRTGIESGVSTIRMYQAMMLVGTEMASAESRRTFDLACRFRVMPGCHGRYQAGGDTLACAEIDEIIVGNSGLSFDDYIACREMNLIIESVINNSLLDEVFRAARALGIATFDILLDLHAKRTARPESIGRIFQSFARSTRAALFETREEAEASALACPESDIVGKNELLGHSALLYQNFRELARFVQDSVESILTARGLWSEGVAAYMGQLVEFVICRKAGVHDQFDPIEHCFDYDFHAIAQAGFTLDPREARPVLRATLRFVMTVPQMSYIRSMIGLYRHHPDGLGRMIQKSNLKKMYRMVERVNPA